MHDKSELYRLLDKNHDDYTKIIELKNPTDGQATTILKGIRSIPSTKLEFPVHIVSCDNGYLFDQTKLMEIDFEKTDVLVWAIKNYPFAEKSPNSYGWAYFDQNGEVREISVKKKLKVSFKVL